VTALYYAMLGLIVERLTLPGVLPDLPLDDLVADIVTAIVPGGADG
jgi:hypothetical protein